MFPVGFGLLIIGYAAVYSGASNLFTGGNGWGFLQSLLNKGSGNADMKGLDALFAGPGGNGNNAVSTTISNNLFGKNTTSVGKWISGIFNWDFGK
jgi:hypothetical protein